MKWILFVCGLVLGVVGSFAVMVYAQVNKKEANDDIVFSQKNFADLGGDTSLAVSGTLTGQGMAYANNTYGIVCRKEEGKCWVTYVEQIGHDQIGSIQTPYSILITRWNTNEVVAADDVTDWACTKTTITISRKTESVLWVDEPVNQTSPRCTHADSQIHKYTIEDSPGWKRVMGRSSEQAGR